jgi:seryl-tRNA synthetase
MKNLVIDNKKLHDLIVKKDELVFAGRKISGEIEVIEAKCKRFEEKEKKITAKVEIPKELFEKGEELTKQMTKVENELNEIGKKIHDMKLEAVPKEIKEEHLSLLREKEVKERDRNKIALKVQKIKDKLIPIVQREVKPLLQAKRIVEVDLGPYDDIQTAKTKEGKVVIETYNRLEDFQKTFRGR